ncbi:MAG: hypothetical protein Q7R95_08100 [bacterium]|nr:hypothetical protein [bacterium]
MEDDINVPNSQPVFSVADSLPVTPTPAIPEQTSEVKKPISPTFFLITIGTLLLLVIAFISIIILGSKKQNKTSNSTIPITITPIPKISQAAQKGETILNASYDLTCHIIITTSIKKITLQKYDRCRDKLRFVISPDKKYISFIRQEENGQNNLYVFSLDNNIYALLQNYSVPIIDLAFDNSNNLVLLNSQSGTSAPYVITMITVPSLFNQYPNNFDLKTNTFTNLEKNKTDIISNEDQKVYKSLQISDTEISILDIDDNVVFVLPIKNVIAKLTPIQPNIIKKETLNWQKRFLFYKNNQFKSADISGNDEIIHTFKCRDKMVEPMGYKFGLFSRSPDGKILAFVIPLQDNSNDKLGEIVLYDLIKDECETTGLKQIIDVNAMLSYSPNGNYIAYVDDKGFNVYNIIKKQPQLMSRHANQDFDPTAVIGPLLWASDSQSVFIAVTKFQQNQVPFSTNIVQIYFDQSLNASENIILEVPFGTVYALSPDNTQLLYRKEGSIYKYDLEKKLSSSYKTDDSVDKITKLVWLRNNIVLCNAWFADKNIKFTQLYGGFTQFVVDSDGVNVLYNSGPAGVDSKSIFIYDLSAQKEIKFAEEKIISGEVLSFYY